MNYILTMTLSGSCLFVLYGLLRLCARGTLREGWYYNLLKVVLLFFLIPLPWLKKGYLWLMERLSSFGGAASGINYSKLDWVLLQGENGWKLNDTMWTQVLILGIWICGAVVWGLALFVFYMRHKRKILGLYEETEQSELKPKTDQLLKEMNIHVPIRFLKCRKDAGPMTVGFLNPIVFYYPQEQTEETEMMLKHEVVHIKRKDMVWRFGSIVLVVMHWYNPLVWLYKKELENVCESSCDELVLEGQTKQARVAYANLIIKYTMNQKGEILGVPLSKGAKEVKRRMKKILKQTKKLPKVVSTMLAVVLVVLSSVTVFAYEDVKVYHADVKIEDIPTNADMAFTPEGEAAVWVNPDYVTNYVRVYDNQFVDIYGNVYEVQEDVETYFYCEHEYVYGTLQYHKELDDGGCVVEFYNANRCQLCGYLTDIEYIAKMEYAVCPH